MSKGLEGQIKDFETRGDVNLPEVQSVSIIQMAIEKNYDPALIEKMMDLQERNEARMAKQAYVKAMAEFKKSPPKILKDRKVEYQTTAGKAATKYSYADLASASDLIDVELSKHSLFKSWTTKQSNGTVTVTCVVSHEMGHSESTELTAEPDDTGTKNKIQALGSTIYYLERYTLFALLGLAAHGQDTDGITGEVETITEKQLSTIVDFINEYGIDESKFLEFLGVAIEKKIESLDKIPANQFDRAIKEIKRNEKKKRDKAEE